MPNQFGGFSHERHRVDAEVFQPLRLFQNLHQRSSGQFRLPLQKGQDVRQRLFVGDNVSPIDDDLAALNGCTG